VRPFVLTLALALPSLAFAPAPFPKAERPARESEQTRQERLLYECRRRLDELGVRWRLERRSVVFNVQHPNGGGGMGGSYGVYDGDVARTLRMVVVGVEEYLGLAPRQKR
jgi:hypothetical protein